MPTRLLRDGILDSEAVNSLSACEEVFYRRLMSAVDDFGRFDGRPSVLRCRLYSLQLSSIREADISRWIAACEKAGLIALYEVDGKPYILLHKLGPPRAAVSKFPAPPPHLVRQMANADRRERAHPEKTARRAVAHRIRFRVRFRIRVRGVWGGNVRGGVSGRRQMTGRENTLEKDG